MEPTAEPESGLINFTIDGAPVQARPGWTILETARQYHIHIPTLCFHPAVKPWGGCRLCVVEVRLRQAQQGDGLLPQPAGGGTGGLHQLGPGAECPALGPGDAPGGLPGFPGDPEVGGGVRGDLHPLPHPNPEEECIRCGLCIAVCTEVVGVQALTFGSRGVNKQIDTPYRVPNNACVACGSCVTVCPTGAMGRRLDQVRGDISRRTGHGYAH